MTPNNQALRVKFLQMPLAHGPKRSVGETLDRPARARCMGYTTS